MSGLGLIIVLALAAAALFAGWRVFAGRGDLVEYRPRRGAAGVKATPTMGDAAEDPGADSGADASAAGDRPALYAQPSEGAPDDLTRLRGVGPKMAAALNAEGVFYLSQVAAWSDGEADWIDARIAARGRVRRDDWPGQARAMLAG